MGKIYFLLVRIKIKHMEIAIIKRETTGAGKCNLHLNILKNVGISDGNNRFSFQVPICSQRTKLSLNMK